MKLLIHFVLMDLKTVTSHGLMDLETKIHEAVDSFRAHGPSDCFPMDLKTFTPLGLMDLKTKIHENVGPSYLCSWTLGLMPHTLDVQRRKGLGFGVIASF